MPGDEEKAASRPWVLMIFAALLVVPFGVNVAGWNVYLYTHVGGSDLILGASEGTCHAAIADHFEGPSLVDYVDIGDLQRDLIEAGPFHLFAERAYGQSWGPHLGLIMDDGYKGLDFPWLILPIAMGVAAAWRWVDAARGVDD